MSLMYYDPARLPAEVQAAVLPPGTLVHGEYRILSLVCLTGTELCYRAEQAETQIPCLLFEMLPLRWCSVDGSGRFVPFHSESAARWDAVRRQTLSHLADLQAFCQAPGIPAVKDGFEAFGTVCCVTRFHETAPLRTALLQRTYQAREAVALLTPLLDTLAGMHDKGLCHGALTLDAIRLTGDTCEVWGWLSQPSLSAACPLDDVRAVSQILWQMLTGEMCYSEAAASALAPTVRAAISNGLNDPDMTIGKLWKQLHTKRPAKLIKPVLLSTEHPSLLTRLFSPAVTAVFCTVCVAAPVVLWQMEAGALTNETATQTLEDVAYTLGEDEMQLPEVLRMEQDEAVRLLEEMGLTVILAPREDNPVVPENQILTQSPHAGALVRPGDSVSLTASDGWANYVPDVCGISLAQAQKNLESLGFVIETEEKLSPDDAPGTVIAQSVRADTRLERDSTIRLTVSLGREDLDVTKLETVGDFVGIKFDDAKEELTALHLYAAQIETVYNADVPAGVILSQDIEPGRTVPQGTVINMVVSKGVETVRVPALLHVSAASARQALESARLKCILCYVSNGEWADGTVLSQSVKDGSLVPVGTEVWLNVSVGSGSYVVSTGGWTGGELPNFWTTEETTEEQTAAPQPDPEPTPGSAETDAPIVPETAPPTEPPQTLPPSNEEELTPPPMPEF